MENYSADFAVYKLDCDRIWEWGTKGRFHMRTCDFYVCLHFFKLQCPAQEYWERPCWQEINTTQKFSVLFTVHDIVTTISIVPAARLQTSDANKAEIIRLLAMSTTVNCTTGCVLLCFQRYVVSRTVWHGTQWNWPKNTFQYYMQVSQTVRNKRVCMRAHKRIYIDSG